ncbi:MAG: prolyl oligopeptidase family serine peptidase [Pseudomonadota bacterium]
MIVERTCYLPKPGKFAEVLATRRRATQVRIQEGLRAGTIYQGQTNGTDWVFWEGRFATEAEHAADLDARTSSIAFEAVRNDMRALIDQFDRVVMRPDQDFETSALRDNPLEGASVAPVEMVFQSGDLELKGFFFKPSGDGPFPCMITNHGSGISQGTSELCRPGIGALLMSWGIASFLPHRRGYGNSPGTPWRDEISAEFGTDLYDERLARRLDGESDDVLAARDHVVGLPDIDPAHIGVMGSSFGGTVTLFAAAKSDQFRCAVEFAGAAMNWERTPKLRETMHAAASKVSCPIYFMQAANDYSARPTIELAAGLEGTSVPVYSKVYPAFGISKDEGHWLYRDGPVLWGDDVRRFLERYL